MPITLERALAHTQKWSEELSRYRTHRWPKFLFHAAQLEVAIEILSSGRLLCRNNVPALICDVANQGALNNNPIAHDFARLYFRPKTPFHFKTEGIKSLSDPNRGERHMSVPVILAFDFCSVVTLPHAFFTHGNFAKSLSVALDGDAQFDQLDFSLVYHDSAVSQAKKDQIHNMRMSEVVVRDGLDLGHLKAVICRTPIEERMLRYNISKRALIMPAIRVDLSQSCFLRRGIFIDEISCSNGVLTLNFHAPLEFPQDAYAICIEVGDSRGNWRRREYLLHNQRWSFPDIPGEPNSVWRVSIEGCLAFEGLVPERKGIF